MHWIDIVLIAVLLVFGFVNLKKGFVHSILSLFGTLVSIILAVLASKPFAGFLEQCFKITNWIAGNIQKMFAGWSTVFATPVTTATTGSSVISNANLGKFPEFILKVVVGDNCVIQAGEAPAQIFANIIAPIALLILAGILAYILINLAVFILTKIFDVLLQNKVINGLDRLLGFVLGVVKGALFICILMGITIFIPNEKIITEIDKTQVTKVVYPPVTDFIRVNIADKLKAWAEDIMPKEETPEETSYTVVLPDGERINIQ